MVYLTGDTHGDIERFKHGKLRWLGKRDVVIVLGDFGFVWDGSKEERKKLDWLRSGPTPCCFWTARMKTTTCWPSTRKKSCSAARCRPWAAMSTTSAGAVC